MYNSKAQNGVLKVNLSVKNVVKIAMLSAVAFGLMFISFPLALIFPSFLKIDLSDLPALLGGFALGPVAGVIIELIKNILNIFIKGTDTGGVGELSNFIVGSAFVVPASLIYHYMKNKNGAFIALVAGTVFMTVLACFSNYYVVFPLYLKFMPLEQIVESSPLKAVKDMKTLILYAIVPFNILKGTLVSTATLLVYKKLSPILHK